MTPNMGHHGKLTISFSTYKQKTAHIKYIKY